MAGLLNCPFWRTTDMEHSSLGRRLAIALVAIITVTGLVLWGPELLARVRQGTDAFDEPLPSEDDHAHTEDEHDHQGHADEEHAHEDEEHAEHDHADGEHQAGH